MIRCASPSLMRRRCAEAIYELMNNFKKNYKKPSYNIYANLDSAYDSNEVLLRFAVGERREILKDHKFITLKMQSIFAKARNIHRFAQNKRNSSLANEIIIPRLYKSREDHHAAPA